MHRATPRWSLHVGLHDQVQVGLLAFLNAVEQVVQAHVGLCLLLGQTRTQGTLFSELAGIALVGEHAELVACRRHAVQTQNLNRVGRTSAVHVLAVRVDQCANATVRSAGNHGVARMKRTALHQHGGNRAAALVKIRLDNEAGSLGIGVRLQLQHVGLQQDGLEQLVDVQLLLSRHVDEHVLTAPVLGDDAVLGQLLTHAIGVRARLIDLVDGNNNRHVCGLRVVDCLDGLRHDAVVGGNYQHDNVGDLRTAGAHGSKCLVARRIDERDLMIGNAHDGSADVLRNAAGLAFGNAGVADGVKQRRFAVVNVAHDRNHRRTRLKVFLAVVIHDRKLFLGRHDAHLAAHVVSNKLNKLIGHGLRKRKHLTKHEQALDHIVGLHAKQLGELGNRGTLGDLGRRSRQGTRLGSRPRSIASISKRSRASASRFCLRFLRRPSPRES